MVLVDDVYSEAPLPTPSSTKPTLSSSSASSSSSPRPKYTPKFNQKWLLSPSEAVSRSPRSRSSSKFQGVSTAYHQLDTSPSQKSQKSFKRDSSTSYSTSPSEDPSTDRPATGSSSGLAESEALTQKEDHRDSHSVPRNENDGPQIRPQSLSSFSCPPSAWKTLSSAVAALPPQMPPPPMMLPSRYGYDYDSVTMSQTYHPGGVTHRLTFQTSPTFAGGPHKYSPSPPFGGEARHRVPLGVNPSPPIHPPGYKKPSSNSPAAVGARNAPPTVCEQAEGPESEQQGANTTTDGMPGNSAAGTLYHSSDLTEHASGTRPDRQSKPMVKRTFNRIFKSRTRRREK